MTGDLTPGKYLLNGMGDLAMECGIRKHIRTEVEVIKKCKSGLYYIRTSDGKFFSVPKFNLDSPEEVAARCHLPPFDPSEWTIEPAQDLPAQHGLDLEDEIANILKDNV